MDPLSIWDRIWEQRHVIADAPESFVIALTIGSIIIWKILRRILGARERQLEDDVRSRDNEIKELNAAITANVARMNLLQEKADDAHRKRVDAEALLERLRPMISKIADPDVRQLATDSSTAASQANSAFKQVESLVFTLVGQTTPDPNLRITRMIGPRERDDSQKD